MIYLTLIVVIVLIEVIIHQTFLQMIKIAKNYEYSRYSLITKRIQTEIKLIIKKRVSQHKNNQNNLFTKKVFIREYHQQIGLDLESEQQAQKVSSSKYKYKRINKKISLLLLSLMLSHFETNNGSCLTTKKMICRSFSLKMSTFNYIMISMLR